MARKKQEIALQVELETQEEWEDMLAKEGLTVVDIYQDWARPCTAMVSNFRRLKNELGDDLLRFAVAKSDTIDALERYRGKCEPCFLFFAGGILVAQVRGANAPLLQRTITEQLVQEHKVLDGTAERKEIKDIMLEEVDTKQEEEEDEEVADIQAKRPKSSRKPIAEAQTVTVKHGEYAQTVTVKHGEYERMKDVTVAIIKPNVVADGKVDEILQQIRDAGIEILKDEEKTLTEEEARNFYSHKKDEDFFEDLVQFMTSGPSHILVITKGETGEGIIEDWRELLGPASVEEAKQQKPDCLRAKYGGDKNYVNALHGSDSKETSMRELAFFFPNFVAPKVSGSKPKPKIQRTLALIRPDALRERKDEILAKIAEAGFQVAMQKVVQFSKEDAEEFYKEHRGEEYFEELTYRMSNGPLMALALAREEAISGWRDLLGPKEVEKAKKEAPESFRAQFSIDDVPINPLHGSDTEENAKKELDYFFPVQKTVAAIKPDANQTKEEIMEKIRQAGFHIAARKETALTREVAEQFYIDHRDKEYFEDLVTHMTSGRTLFMVLTREDAVAGWRSLMGPTDPNKAKEENPETLRAQFGTDIKANAVHGSSTPKHAEESMKLIFGDLQFHQDGDADRPKSSSKKQDADESEKKDESSEVEKEKAEEDKEEERDRKSPAGDDKHEGDKKSVKGEDKEEGDTKSVKEDTKDADDKKSVKSIKDNEDDKKSIKSAKGDDDDKKSVKSTKDDDHDNKSVKSAKGDDGEDKKSVKSAKDDDDKKSIKSNKEEEKSEGDKKEDTSDTKHDDKKDESAKSEKGEPEKDEKKDGDEIGGAGEKTDDKKD